MQIMGMDHQFDNQWIHISMVVCVPQELSIWLAPFPHLVLCSRCHPSDPELSQSLRSVYNWIGFNCIATIVLLHYWNAPLTLHINEALRRTFLAAKSLWTNPFLDMYPIPAAISLEALRRKDFKSLHPPMSGLLWLWQRHSSFSVPA